MIHRRRAKRTVSQHRILVAEERLQAVAATGAQAGAKSSLKTTESMIKRIVQPIESDTSAVAVGAERGVRIKFTSPSEHRGRLVSDEKH